MTSKTDPPAKTLTDVGATEPVPRAHVDNGVRAANGTAEWWNQWSVPISAAGLLISIISLAFSIHQQTSALEQQATAIRRQTNIEAVSVSQRLRNELTEGGFRFEQARAAGNQGMVVFERNRMLFTVEAYLEDLETLQLEQGSQNRLLRGVLQVLATGFCRPADGPESSGPRFASLGFPTAGALADELGVMTCLP